MRTKYKNARDTRCSFVIFFESVVKLYESKRSPGAFYSNSTQLNICSNMLTNTKSSVWLNKEKKVKERITMKKSRYDTIWKISGLNPNSSTQGTMSKVFHLFYGLP